MGYLFTHVTNDVFWSPHLKQGHRTRYLFLGDHNPAANKGTPRIKEHLKIEGADKAVCRVNGVTPLSLRRIGRIIDRKITVCGAVN